MEAEIIKKDELEYFAAAILRAACASTEDAKIVAESLVWADLRGRHPQGLSRLPNFVRRLQRKLISSPANMQWIETSSSAAILDADNAFGHVAGIAAMKKAMAFAKQNGVGVTAVRHSNLYGAAAYFCSLAAEENCIGFTCTNAVSKVAPFGGIRPVFGTNPLAFGCPTSSGIPILIDLATSALAGSAVRSLNEKEYELPVGVAIDKSGKPTINPADLADGSLLPAAGSKGFALAMMVEILSGILSGAAVSKEVGSMYSTWDRPVNTGHFCFVIDIKKFLPIDLFLHRIDMMIEWMKSASSVGETVRFPGEIRGDLAAEYTLSGIPLPSETVASLSALASELDVPFSIQQKN